MAGYCLCCGKKMGFLATVHVDGAVCDACYDNLADYMDALRISATKDDVIKNYDAVIAFLKESGFAEEGCRKIVDYSNNIRREINARFFEEEQISANNAKK